VVEPYQFVFDSPQVRASFELADYASASFPPETPLLAGAADLTRRIFEDFKFDPQATTVATPAKCPGRRRIFRVRSAGGAPIFPPLYRDFETFCGLAAAARFGGANL